jgi:hypothetical protein
MKTTCWVLGTMLLAGCGLQCPINPPIMQIATEPLVCRPDTCGEWWSRAREWVAAHGDYPIKASNDTLIETTGPDGGSPKLAYEITKAENGDGTATIGFAAHCDSALGNGCKPDPWLAAAAFKTFVKSGVDSGLVKPRTPQ